MAQTLIDFLADSAARRGRHVAIEDLRGSLSYGELDALSDRVRDRLRRFGVEQGDRVGIYMQKSIDAYAAILGAMKAGAAYVPIDSSAPSRRSAFITTDCDVKVLVIESSLVSAWREAVGGSTSTLLPVDKVGGGLGLARALDSLDLEEPAPCEASARLSGSDLAYILYTSGSTGTPKGVMLTHECAVSFVDWCSAAFCPTPEDRFSSHAPFHFDLSILDLYVPLKHGGTVVLIDANQGKEPLGLAKFIADRELTVWYSTPTILTLLAEHGRMDQHDLSRLRYVLFAGEVFPIKHLRSVKKQVPHARLFNLYGPTETNVCTWYPIPSVVEAERTEPYPIGETCQHFQSRVVDDRGIDVDRGVAGELVIHGRGVMTGYWNMPQRTAEAFFSDAEGRRWYRTGDLVTEDAQGVFTFLGRRDRMVKRRGYRIELGDIEAGLYQHAGVKEAAVVALGAADGSTRIKAFLSLTDGHRSSEIEMRMFCAKILPTYMMPDAFEFVAVLPKTSTDKTDYQRLAHAG